MIQRHRRELIEECFSLARPLAEKQYPHDPRWMRVFSQAGKLVSEKTQFNAKVDFQDYVDGQGFPDTPKEWAIRNNDRVQQDPVQAMSDWIDHFPRARPAVDAYCAGKAQEELIQIATKTRKEHDLASPEEALGRRNRGRAM